MVPQKTKNKVIIRFEQKDLALKLLFISESVSEVLGLTAKALLADNELFQHCFASDVYQSFVEELSTTQSENQIFEADLSLKHAIHDDEVILHFHLVPEQNGEKSTIWIGSIETKSDETAESKATNIVASLDQISQAKRKEDELALLNCAISQIDDAVMMMNEQAQIVYVNDAACKAHGYTREELLGSLTLPDLNDDWTIEFWQDYWEKNHQRREPIYLQTHQKRKNGEAVPVEVVSNFVEFSGVTYKLSIGRDISQRLKSESELKLLNFHLDNQKNNVYLVDEDAYFVYVNEEACRVLGYSREEMIGKMRVCDIDPDITIEKWASAWLSLRKNGFYRLETTNRTKDGRLIPFEVNSTYGVFDGTEYAFAVLSDITQRKQAQQQLDLLSFGLNSQRDAVYVIDKDSIIHYVNDQTCKYTGYSREEMVEKMSITDLKDDFSREDWDVYWLKLKAKGSLTFEAEHTTKQGDMLPVEVTATYCQFGGFEYSFTTVRDIRERKEHEAKIEYLAYHDSLTGLPNRAYTLIRLEAAMADTKSHKGSLALLFIDLDRFKVINDTLGHTVGDLLLKQVTIRLKQVVREADIVGRVGGDEFLIIVPNIPSENYAAQVAEAVLATLVSRFDIDNHTLHIGASIGISLYPKDGLAAELLIKYADNALYWAKEHGRNTFRFFSRYLDELTHRRLSLEHALRKALDEEQFFIVFQPQVDAATEAYIGVEALLRWKHPELGVISPAEFIPIAEETGLIIQIGEWVLRSACEKAKQAWELGYKHFRVAVNVSIKQLEDSNFIQMVADIMAETECPHQAIEMEVTESSAMQEPEYAISALKRIRDMGICISLDDFGTGYSNLAYLKRFPLDRLKIDRSFIDGIPENVDDMGIVQTTVLLAQQLGLEVVAEGVETAAQKNVLRGCGCQSMQGFYFCKPTHWDVILTSLKTSKA